jgi:hypothetical protein
MGNASLTLTPIHSLLTMTVRTWTRMVRSKKMEHMTMYKTLYDQIQRR